MQQVQIDLESELKAYMQQFPPSPTLEAAEYALFGGGKRVRPLLFLSLLEHFGYPVDSALLAALSLEMVHTYSLIHDDLPAMDDDDTRRGRPTVHKVFGEGIAILAGDFLLTLAFETLAKAPIPADTCIEMILILTQAAGIGGMIGGQTLDLTLEGHACSIEQIHTMHRLKTGALFGACFECAALLLGKDRNQFRVLGETYGTIFQMKNDLKDPVERNSDAKKKKATLVNSTPDPEKILEREQERFQKMLFNVELKLDFVHCRVKENIWHWVNYMN